MQIEMTLDTKKVQKALNASQKQMERLHKRAAKRTAVNARAIASKGSLGIDGLRRKKVPRARVKPLNRGEKVGVWFGLNDIRASEFREKPVKEGGGVRFQGKHHDGYFIARFRHDPAGVKRAVKASKGSSSWEELMVPIEKEARQFIESEIQPEIEGLFNKNFEQAVDHQAQIKWNK